MKNKNITGRKENNNTFAANSRLQLTSDFTVDLTSKSCNETFISNDI